MVGFHTRTCIEKDVCVYLNTHICIYTQKLMLFSVFLLRSSMALQQHRIIHKKGGLKKQKIERARGRKRIEGEKIVKRLERT